MFSSPINTRLQPARAAFSTKFGDAVAQGVDLDDELQAEPFLFAHLDQPVENRLPIAVAGEIVVGDEKSEDALGEVGAHQPLDVVGVAPARFPALHVDDRAKAALERAAAPGVEGAEALAVAAHDAGRQKRRHLPLQSRQIVHVIVEWLQPARERVGKEAFEPALGLAGEQAHPQPLRLFEIGRQTRQHRQTTRHVKPADRDLDAGSSELGRQIHGSRELVRLHAHQADEASLGACDAPDDPPDRDDRMTLVIGVDFDRHIGAERLARGDVGSDAVETSQ